MAADPFKPVMPVQFRYAETGTLSTGGFAITFGTEQTFRLNSLFDPDLTSGGHQPYGFDQLTPIYGAYRVKGCLVDIEFFGSNSDDVVAAFTVQTGQNTTALTSSTLREAVERQSVMTRNMPINGDNRWRHREYFPIHKVCGLPASLVANNPNYSALVGANPAEQVYLRLAAATQVNTSKAVNYSITLTYDADMYDRKSMAAS